MNSCKTVLALLSLAAAELLSANAVAQTPATMNEQVVMVKVGSGLWGAELETTLFKPDGNGPFPLVVINHGKALGDPVFQERARHLRATREFVRRGYAVALPMRLGFSKSSGSYIAGGCNIASNGDMQAEWVAGVIEWLRQQLYVDRDRIVVVGQSHGGLTAMALGARNPAGVRGIINFAGGLKYIGGSCIWENSLAQAFADYGARSKLPSLWFYGDNDGYFPPDVWKDLHEKYRAAGGKVRLVAFGTFHTDAHGMFSTSAGLPIWVPEVERFLESVGLPSMVSVAVSEPPRPAATDFAKLEAVAAVPHVRDTGRQGYTTFLQKGLPRAFAISRTGAWGWANEGDDPTERAVANCQKHSKEPCRLYAVDEDVVWKP
jgi:dienelactone hydrolase